ncbi:DUF5780 domain-containing protein [Macrococcus equi]|uniref:DUF5780 domain-containing protein n=1 Tax=Macrococcus equi TaxID=3395462 RepID=UPI0039BE79A8
MKVLKLLTTLSITSLILLSGCNFKSETKENFKEENRNQTDSKNSKKKIKQLNVTQLEKELKKQKVYIEKVKFVSKNTVDQYIRTWDQIIPSVKNNSKDDIKNIVIGVVGWDSNGLPLKPDFALVMGGQEDYLIKVKIENVNMIPNSLKEDIVFNKKDEQDIEFYKFIVLSYEDYNGKIWDNPLIDDFEQIYSGKRLKDIKGNEKTIFNIYNDKIDNNVSDKTLEQKNQIPNNNQIISDEKRVGNHDDTKSVDSNSDEINSVEEINTYEQVDDDAQEREFEELSIEQENRWNETEKSIEELLSEES